MKKVKKVVALLSSSLGKDIKFFGIINRDDIVVIITREMVESALKKYEDKVMERNGYVLKPYSSAPEIYNHICKVRELMDKHEADIILLDDRDPYDTSFYYRCD